MAGLPQKASIVVCIAAILFSCVHCGLKTEPIPPELVKDGERPIVGIGAPKLKKESDEKEILDIYGEKKSEDAPESEESSDKPKGDEVGAVDWNEWPEMPEDESIEDTSEDSATSESSDDQSQPSGE